MDIRIRASIVRRSVISPPQQSASGRDECECHTEHMMSLAVHLAVRANIKTIKINSWRNNYVLYSLIDVWKRTFCIQKIDNTSIHAPTKPQKSLFSEIVKKKKIVLNFELDTSNVRTNEVWSKSHKLKVNYWKGIKVHSNQCRYLISEYAHEQKKKK